MTLIVVYDLYYEHESRTIMIQEMMLHTILSSNPLGPIVFLFREERKRVSVYRLLNTMLSCIHTGINNVFVNI